MAYTKNPEMSTAILPGDPQPSPQPTDSETYSKNLLGPVTFELSNLNEEPSEMPTQESESSQPVVELADAEVEEPSEMPTQESESSQPIVELADAEAGRNVFLSTNQGEWRSFASFRVEFQARQIEREVEEQRITVHYLEADKFQTWSDIESERLQEWMLDKIIERMQQSPEAEIPVVTPTVVVEIDKILAFQAPHTERPMVAQKGHRLFPGTISSKKPFALEIAFSLAGLHARHITKQQVAYSAQFYARNRLTEVVTHLGDTELGTLIKGQRSYTAVLAETRLEAGVYRLQALVKLQGLPATLASFKVPLLQVV